MQIKTARLNDSIAGRIRQGDIINLEVVTWNGLNKFVKVKVVEINTKSRKCAGCTCKLSVESGRNKLKGKIYCDDCYDKHKDD